jgi:hypothetical protein
MPDVMKRAAKSTWPINRTTFIFLLDFNYGGESSCGLSYLLRVGHVVEISTIFPTVSVGVSHHGLALVRGLG